MVVILIFIKILSLYLFSKWSRRRNKAFSGCLEHPTFTFPLPTASWPPWDLGWLFICFFSTHLFLLEPALWLLPTSTWGSNCCTSPLFSHGDLGMSTGQVGVTHVLHGAGKAVAIPPLGWQQHSRFSRWLDRDMSPTVIQVVRAFQWEDCSPLRVISPLWIRMANQWEEGPLICHQWERDIDLPTLLGAPHFHSVLEPTNYVAGLNGNDAKLKRGRNWIKCMHSIQHNTWCKRGSQ